MLFLLVMKVKELVVSGFRLNFFTDYLTAARPE